MVSIEHQSHIDSDTSEALMEHSKMAHKHVDVEKTRSSKHGIMQGHYLEIFFASLVLIIPMTVLTIIFMSLVYTHLMPNYNSTYSKADQANIPLGSAYYVNYSATRLVFISSISSTLAPFLISAAMILFSYPLAHSFTKNSDKDAMSKLPSPYQLELIIEAVDARLKSLWSMLLYVFGSKQKRITVISDLWKSIAMLASLGVLALLTSLADVWLHVATTSVQYLQVEQDVSFPNFAPGRGLKEECLNATIEPTIQRSSYLATPCVVNSAGSGGGGGLQEEAEYIRTAGNQSSTNRVYLSDGQAVIGPANAPSDIDFQASSFASHTSCRMVTELCGAHFIKPDSEASRDISYNCNATVAGLNATGNFSDIYSSSSSSSSQQTQEDYKARTANSILGFGPSSGDNTGIAYPMGFRYYKDASMSISSNMSFRPDTPFTPSLYWAFIFSLNRGSSNLRTGAFDPGRGLIGMVGGGLGGIMSCSTNLSEVTFSMTNGSVFIDKSTLMNNSAPLAFIGAMDGGFGIEQIKQGLERAVASAKTPEDVSAGLASAYDQTMVSLPAGVLLQRPPLNVTRRVQTLVTRMPKAPFAAVIVTNLLYAVLGIFMTVTALLVLRLGSGVRDTQARLSSAAIVAESFESPALGDDATEVGDLYAERRGMPTRRVAVVKRKDGGRRYKQVVVRQSTIYKQ